MKQTILTLLVLLSSGLTFATSGNLPGPKTSVTTKVNVGGIQFDSTAAKPNPLIIEITSYKHVHSDGDFAVYDKDGKLRFKLDITSNSREFKYLNSAGTTMITMEISKELGTHLSHHLSGASSTCPRNIFIDRNRMVVTNVELTCDLYE